MTPEVEEATTWLAWLATATVGGMPMKTSTGAIRNPPPMPNSPDTNPTVAPNRIRSGQFTETSAIGR